MAELLNQSQPGRVSVLRPAGVYSRVVAVQVDPCVQWEYKWQFTPPVGNDVVLLRVQVFLQHEHLETVGTVEDGFMVYTAQVAPSSAAEVRRCEAVVPVFASFGISIWWNKAQVRDYEWTMRRYYKGAERRFGLYVENSEDSQLIAWASFEISEG